MNIKQKLIGALAILAVIILVLGASSLLSLSNLSKQNEIYNTILAADTLMYKARLAQADYLLLREAHFKRSVESVLDEVTISLNNAKSMMKIEENRAVINSIIAAKDDYRRSFNQLAQLPTGNVNQQPALLAKVLSDAQNASTLLENLLQNEKNVANQVTSKTSTRIIIVLFVSVLIAIVLAVMLTKTIVRGIKSCKNASEKTENGDFSSSFAVRNKDEFGELLSNMNASTKKVREVLAKIISGLNAVNESNHKVDNAVIESNSSMELQKSESEALASAVAQLSATNEQIAKHAKVAANTSEEAGQQAADGDSIVKSASSAMSELSSQLQDATVEVDKLNQDSDNIADILDVIRGIAEQTNLLALNAAIEAARAGEQGRGFAVVADEVRTLAARTQNSIEEITSLINLIQSGARNVVEVINSSNEKSVAVMSLTDKASVAYANITESVHQLSNVNQEVAVGAQEQTHVTLDTSKRVERIFDLADTNAKNLADIAMQAERQTSDMDALKDLLRFFKL